MQAPVGADAGSDQKPGGRPHAASNPVLAIDPGLDASSDRVRLASQPSTSAALIKARAEHLSTSTMLATAGGFLDAFTYVGHGHIFANSMTGNVVLLGVAASSSNWYQAFQHLPPILLFLLGVWAARALNLPAMRRYLPDTYITVLVIELVILVPLIFLPAGAPDFWTTSSIAFAASMQVQTFRNVAGYSYNSTFTTGNLRTLSVGLFDWCLGGKKEEGRSTTLVFTAICTAFLLGAVIGGAAVKHLGNRALFIELVLLLLALALLLFEGPLRVESATPTEG